MQAALRAKIRESNQDVTEALKEMDIDSFDDATATVVKKCAIIIQGTSASQPILLINIFYSF